MNIIKILTLTGIFLILSGIVIASLVEKEYLLLEMNYNAGEFELIEKTIEKGNYPEIEHNLNHNYKARLISDTEEILFSVDFNPTLLYTDSFDGEMEGGLIELESNTFFIIAPNFRKANKVQILEENKKVFETGVYDVGATSCRIK